MEKKKLAVLASPKENHPPPLNRKKFPAAKSAKAPGWNHPVFPKNKGKKGFPGIPAFQMGKGK